MRPFAYRDISTETEERYVLEAGERQVFFLGNRSGSLVFRLAGPGAEAHVYAAFAGKKDERFALSVTQEHAAPDTRSSLTLRSVLAAGARVELDGLIRIEAAGGGSDAFQDGRALLIGPGASQKMRPALEILPQDVTCRHAAAVSPVNQDALFALRARGLSEEAATDLLARGFLAAPLSELGGLVPGADMRGSVDALAARLT